jgi:hypothetical protein
MKITIQDVSSVNNRTQRTKLTIDLATAPYAIGSIWQRKRA